MKTILVTGSIGSGKSAVCRHLAGRGFPVYDCDSRCKALYDTVPGLKAQIEEAIGLPFSRLCIIFEDEARRDAVEAIVLPLLRDDIERWRSSLNSDVCIVESATALSKPVLEGLFDEVWLIEAAYGLRASRNPKVAQRDAIQSFDRSAVTHVIENNSSLEDLYSKTDNLI